VSTSPTPFSVRVSVHSGDRITLQTSVLLNTGCAETGATLTVTEIPPAPTVTLASPANGATITGGQPSFAGTADTGFGAQGTVAVRIYGGTTTGGIPVRTLSAAVSNGRYSATAIPALPDGTYTAQAEQDSAAGTEASARGTLFRESSTRARNLGTKRTSQSGGNWVL
jgi:Bacterial Ig domain